MTLPSIRDIERLHRDGSIVQDVARSAAGATCELEGWTWRLLEVCALPTVSFHTQGHGVAVSQKVCSWMRLPSDGSCMALACLSSICDGSRVCRDAAVVLDVLQARSQLRRPRELEGWILRCARVRRPCTAGYAPQRLQNRRATGRQRPSMQQASNVRSAIKDVDDAGKLEHIEDEHCDGERTCNHGHREP